MGAHTFHQRAELSRRIFCDGGDVSELPVHYSSPPERLHVASVMEKLKFESNFFFLDVGILVPQPGMEPTPGAGEARTLSHWPAREVPNLILIN